MKSVIGVLAEVAIKNGAKGEKIILTWLRESKSPWGVTARSVGQDDKGCPILTGHVSATEVNLKVSGVWLLKVVSMLNVAIKRWVTFEIVLKKTKTKIESNS